LVKPYATRAGKAGFFFKEGGQIRDDLSAREFPFRRDELGGGQKARQAVEDTVNGNAMTKNPVAGGGGMNQSLFSQSDATSGGGEARVPPAPSSISESAVPKRTLRLRGGWVWVPASFVFLLVGTIIGFQVALSVHTKVTQAPDPYTLNLSATPSADSIHLRWDRTSPAIQLAQKGTLVILEDGQQKNVDLDAGHLRNGSVIYRRASDQVSFRLEVFTSDRVSISETVDFHPVTPTAQK
jgi:hypothetical protein